jgi:ADP-ribosyl-[dinitrogen reductase] hydrolase
MGAFRPDPNVLKKHPNAVTLPQLQHRERFIGTLLGLAAGEAQGAQAAGESMSGAEIALVMLRSVRQRGRLELPDIAQGLLRWFGSAPKKVPDLMRAALENLRAGESHEQSGALAWEDAGRDAPHHGSVVWAGPIAGLLHSKEIEGLAEEAAALSRITHHDPRSVAGCAAVATAVALLVRGDKDADETVPRAALVAGAISDEVRYVIERGSAKKPDQVSADKARGSALTTVELAFSTLANAASFEEGASAVVARGGDAEANGAVAGALLGAKFGKAQIPERWLKQAKCASELASLAETLSK